MWFELAHQMDLLPMLAVLVLHRRGREVPAVAWLLGFAWLASWAGSSLQHFAGGEWWTSYLWLPVHFALVLAAVAPSWPVEVAVGCLVVAMLSAHVSAPGPDVLLTVSGSILVLVLARGWVRVPLLLYFGLGTVCYLLMAQRIGESIMPSWAAYQVARASAYVAFVLLLVVPRWRERWSG